MAAANPKLFHPLKSAVYIVDDDEEIRRSTSFLLTGLGFQCDTFVDGRHFLMCLGGMRPGHVLLDLRMPCGSAAQVQQSVEAERAGWTVLLMSGSSRAEFPHLAQGDPIRFLHKPFTEADLLEALGSDAFHRERPNSQAG